MQIYLVQHGEAVAKEVDADRPLSERGTSDVVKVAGFLNEAGVKPAAIHHSGKTRARQTAEIFAEKLNITDPVTAIPGIDPNDAVEDFAGKLNEYPDNTMFVGHLPFMAKLVACLVSGNSEAMLTAYQPGSIVYLAEDEIKHWQIAWMLRPEIVNS